jgi:hypothetical protein
VATHYRDGRVAAASERVFRFVGFNAIYVIAKRAILDCKIEIDVD